MRVAVVLSRGCLRQGLGSARVLGAISSVSLENLFGETLNTTRVPPRPRCFIRHLRRTNLGDEDGTLTIVTLTSKMSGASSCR